MNSVDSKRDFVRRYQRGEFGNCSPTYDSLDEFFAEPHPTDALYHIRNRVPQGKTFYDVPTRQVPSIWKYATTELNIRPADLYISAMCPTERTLYQGYLGNKDPVKALWEFHWTDVKRPMRDALAERSHIYYGPWGPTMAKSKMTPVSADWLDFLIQEYPGHVIEFTVLEVCWGTVPHHNTLFWEVRNY